MESPRKPYKPTCVCGWVGQNSLDWQEICCQIISGAFWAQLEPDDKHTDADVWSLSVSSAALQSRLLHNSP